MDLKKMAAGSKYRTDWKPKLEVHENHAQEWVTNMVPNLVSGMPACRISSSDRAIDDPILKKLQVVLNCWGNSVGLKKCLIEHAYDMQYDFPVGLVSTEAVQVYDAGEEPGVDQEAGRPSHIRPMVYRIPPQRFFRDYQTVNRFGSRGIGHIWIEDKDSLAKAKLPNGKPRYDKDALDAAGVDDEVRAILDEMGIALPGSGIDREQVVGYEVYVPETGMIYTLTNEIGGSRGNNGTYLCEPRRYRGPATGPYTTGGVTLIPDQVYPLPPLAIIHDVMLEINRHAGQASDDAGTAKRLMVVDADPQSIGKMQTALNNTVLGIPGFKGAAAMVTTGGANPDQLAYIQVLNSRLDKMLGMTDAIRGNATGATATELDTIRANRNLRVQWAQARFADFVGSMYRVAAWHFVNNPRAYQKVQHTDEITGDVYTGAYDDGELASAGIKFEDLHIEIDVSTMGPQDDALQTMNMMKGLEWAGANAQVMVANPHLNWENLAEDFYAGIGKKGRGKRYVNFELLKAMQAPVVIQAMQAQAALQGMMSGQMPAQPMPGQPMGGPPQQAPQVGGPPQIAPTSPTRQAANQQGQALRLAQ